MSSAQAMPQSYFQLGFKDRINHVHRDDSGRLLGFREGDWKIKITRNADGLPLTAVSTHPIAPTESVEFLYNQNGMFYDTSGMMLSEVMPTLMQEARNGVNFEKVALQSRSLGANDLLCVILAHGVELTIPTDVVFGFSLASINPPFNHSTVYIFQVDDEPCSVIAGAGVTLTGVAPAPVKFRMTKVKWTGANTWAFV